jgi:hypothetical protein
MDETNPKFFVFVLMPFAEKFLDLYELGIRQVCKDAGAYCERVDEAFFCEGILDRIYNQISKADAIVAVMTDRNPNVFYEVGYAHALGKRVCLLTSTAEDIPFDLKHYSHVVYRDRIAELKTRLQSWLEWCIAHPSDSLARAEVPVRVLVDGVEAAGDRIVRLRRDYNPAFARLEFAIRNPTALLYPKGSFQVGVVTPAVFVACRSTQVQERPPRIQYQVGPDHRVVPVAVPHAEYPEAQRFPLPDGRILHLLDWWSQVLFPGGWAAACCDLKHETEMTLDDVHDLAIRLFTELGSKDFPFKGQIVRAGS